MDEEQKRTFDNTSSSYLSLKAELLRKKQDFQKASSASISSSAILDNLQSTSSSLRLKTKADLDIEVANPSKKKKKNEASAPPPPPPPSAASLSREDEIAFAKSRAILEAKSKLYDQIMSNSDMRLLAEDNGDDDDNDKSFLVDFERKIYETNQTTDKIEYTDSFGRTRLVTPEEYEQLKSTEKKHSSERISSIRSETDIDRVERLHREEMRSKWEAEMEALRNKTHVHYQDVLFDEKREHGVGFYKFSTDDKQREEQMATLNELRTNTKIEQNKFMYEKEKRQSNMAERLNKMRLRKMKELKIDLADNNPNQKETTPISEDQSALDIKDSISDRKEETPEPSSDRKNDDQLKELNVHQTSRPAPPQLSQQTLPLTRTHQPSQQQPSLPNSSSSFAYPFPVMRSSTISTSSLSSDHDIHLSDEH